MWNLPVLRVKLQPRCKESYFTCTSVLQEKLENMRHLLWCVSDNNTVSFTHSNSVLVVNVLLLAAQRYNGTLREYKASRTFWKRHAL